MTEQKKTLPVHVYLQVTEERRAEFDLDVEEFLAWGGDINNPRAIVRYLDEHRDSEEILDSLVGRSLRTNNIGDYAEIDKVVIL